MSKCLIKNTKKYNVLKLATGLNLDNTLTIYRYGTFGISTETYKSTWFLTPKGRAIFKSFDGNYMKGFAKNRIVNELLCSIIGKQIDVKIAEYEPATINGETGLVSYDVAKSGERLLELYRVMPEFNKPENLIYPYVCHKLKFVKDYFVDTDEIDFELFKMLVFDALTFQEDRHAGNVFFVVDKNNFLHLSPLIDNEMSFGANIMGFPHLTNISRKKFLEMHIKEIRFLPTAEVLCYKKEERFKKIIQRLADCTLFDRYKKEFLINALKNIDVVSAFMEIEQMGYNVSKEYQDYVYDLVDMVKEEFKTALKKVKENKIDFLGVKFNVK